MKVSSCITMINSTSLTPWLIQMKNFLTMQESPFLSLQLNLFLTYDVSRSQIMSFKHSLDQLDPSHTEPILNLLKDAAFHLDQATKRGNKTRRTNVHFSGPNDEDAHHNLSSDDHQVIQQENVCSEPPESLSYSLFQSHFQGSSTPNTQKIFLPKPIWEKLSKDQQQMIIDHNRSLPKSGSTHLSTPNKSPSPLPHKPTPQQTAKSQQVHTHQSDEGTTDTTKTETTPSDPLLAMVHQSIHTSDDDASDISNVLSVKRSRQIQVCQRYLFQHANHTNQQLVDRGAKWRPCWFRYACHPQNPLQD